jgi:hypothetical protein
MEVWNSLLSNAALLAINRHVTVAHLIRRFGLNGFAAAFCRPFPKPCRFETSRKALTPMAFVANNPRHE